MKHQYKLHLNDDKIFDQRIGGVFLQVTNMRNQVMHSASFEVSAEDFQLFAGRIRALGEALGEKVPEFQSFSRDVAEVGVAGAMLGCP